MLIVSDYKCQKCDNLFEKFAERDAVVPCTICNGETKRMIAAPRCKLDGTSGDFPGESMKWARKHEKAARTSNS